MSVKQDITTIFIKQLKRCETIDELFIVYLDIEDARPLLTDFEIDVIDRELDAVRCRILYPSDPHLTGYKLN